VANTPILFYGIRSMVAAGITEIGIIVGDTKDEMMAAVGDGSRFGASVTYIEQEAPLGLAHCVLIARDFLGDDEFVMYLGDNETPKAVVVTNVLWCGECRPQPEPIEMPEFY
jgi:glucose-1-phosphate thymidylyltransferase